MSDDTWKRVEGRRALKAKQEAAMTTKQMLATTNIYSKTNHVAKRSCRRDNKTRIDETAQETEEI